MDEHNNGSFTGTGSHVDTSHLDATVLPHGQADGGLPLQWLFPPLGRPVAVVALEGASAAVPPVGGEAAIMPVSVEGSQAEPAPAKKGFFAWLLGW